MPFNRLNNPNTDPAHPMKAFHLEGPGVGGPEGPMFVCEVMVLSHDKFGLGPDIMKEIDEALSRIMASHLGIPNDVDVSNGISEAKIVDIASKRH